LTGGTARKQIESLPSAPVSSLGEGEDFIDLLVRHAADQQKLINPYS
jgi:hypothetical protein